MGCDLLSPRPHLAVLVQSVEDGAVGLSLQPDVEATQLSHELLDVQRCDRLQEVDVICIDRRGDSRYFSEMMMSQFRRSLICLDMCPSHFGAECGSMGSIHHTRQH